MNPDEREALQALDQLQLAALWTAVRTNLERRSLRVDSGTVTLRNLTDAEMAAVCSLLGRRRPSGSTVRVDVAQLDAVLRDGRHGIGVIEVIEALGGPIRDRPSERAVAALNRDSLHSLLLDHPAAADDDIKAWAESLRPRGRLTRLGVTAPDDTVSQALDVVAALRERRGGNPPPVPLAVLAADLLGDAHGLDDEGVVAQLVTDAVQVLSGETSSRRAWATFQVDVDAVNSSVLALGLPGPPDSILGQARRTGEPLRFTSRMLRPGGPLATSSDLTGVVVSVCENPSIVAAAADTLGPSCAPLVCTDGMPKFVTSSLIALLTERGASVRVHADFDVGGVAIVRHLIGVRGVQPWRFGRSDYLAALRYPSLPLGGVVGPTPWDEELALEMNTGGTAVHEEALVDVLLGDLRST